MLARGTLPVAPARRREKTQAESFIVLVGTECRKIDFVCVDEAEQVRRPCGLLKLWAQQGRTWGDDKNENDVSVARDFSNWLPASLVSSEESSIHVYGTV